MQSGDFTVLDFAQRLDGLQAKGDIWRAFTQFAAPHGFEYSGYMDLPGPGERLPDKLICNSLPMEWFEYYVRNNYTARDPALAHLVRARQPFTMEDVRSCPDYEPDQLRILSEAGEFGIKAGLNIPLRSPTNAPAMICLAGRTASSLSPHALAEIHLAAVYADMRLRPVFAEGEQLPALTDRQRQCLQWVAAGKSDGMIAEILRISEKTVNFHIEAVKRKYGVSSRTLAATMALKAGVISL